MAHRKAPPGSYKVRDHFGTYRTIEIDNLLVAARHAALGRFVEQPTLTSPTDTTRYLEAALGHLEHERFCVVWLDNRRKVLRFDELSRGTVDGASVYPREVVKAALSVNASAAIFGHYVPRHIMRVMLPILLCGLFFPSPGGAAVSTGCWAHNETLDKTVLSASER